MGRTSIGVYDETKRRFNRVKAKLMLKNGKEHSDDEVLNKLIDQFLGVEEK